jgi:16S rRNA C1402 N4-methylase RsmH
MSENNRKPFQTIELYIFEDRNQRLCMRMSSSAGQTRRLVLTTSEADQLTDFMVNVSERYGKEVIALALEVLKAEHVKDS